jgi:putative endonuclease
VTWFLYILRSEARGHFYTGITTAPLKRVNQHNGVLKGGAKATRAGRPWQLVYLEACPDKSTALRREAALKRLGRPAKVALVERHRQVKGVPLCPPKVERR